MSAKRRRALLDTRRLLGVLRVDPNDDGPRCGIGRCRISGDLDEQVRSAGLPTSLEIRRASHTYRPGCS